MLWGRRGKTCLLDKTTLVNCSWQVTAQASPVWSFITCEPVKTLSMSQLLPPKRSYAAFAALRLLWVLQVCRLFDLFMATHPLMPLYVGAAAMQSQRQQLLAAEEMPMLHSQLVNLSVTRMATADQLAIQVCWEALQTLGLVLNQHICLLLELVENTAWCGRCHVPGTNQSWPSMSCLAPKCGDEIASVLSCWAWQ